MRFNLTHLLPPPKTMAGGRTLKGVEGVILNNNIKKDCKKIYQEFGFTSQMNKLREEFTELLEAVQKFVLNTNKKSFEDALEEITDYEVVKVQIESNCCNKERTIFMSLVSKHCDILNILEIEETYKNIYSNNKEEINKIAEFKVKRTLERISSNYYN